MVPPESWTCEVKALEQRPGGASHIVMHGPNGEVSDGVGVFLEVVPLRRLVFTLPTRRAGSRPAGPREPPCGQWIVEVSDAGIETRYSVTALHWSREAQKRHEEMGFHQGWNQTTVQLEALARSLGAA